MHRWQCRIYGCGGGRLHAGCHAAAAPSPGAPADSQGVPECVRGSGFKTLSSDLSSAAVITGRKQCHEGAGLRSSNSSEADGKQQAPFLTSKPTPLWPLSAKAHTTSPSLCDGAESTGPALLPGSSSSEGAHALQRLSLHEAGCDPSTADAAAVLTHDDHVSNSRPDTAPDVSESHIDATTAGSSQPSNSRSKSKTGLQRPHELIGRELFIAASMLNHSCKPNCVVAREAGHARIVTQGPIEVSPHPDEGLPALDCARTQGCSMPSELLCHT